jgi:hypothetical protein
LLVIDTRLKQAVQQYLRVGKNLKINFVEPLDLVPHTLALSIHNIVAFSPVSQPFFDRSLDIGKNAK